MNVECDAEIHERGDRGVRRPSCHVLRKCGSWARGRQRKDGIA